MAFSQSFTGKGTGIELPQGSAVQAQQGLNQMILDAEKLRYSVYEKNRNEFLKSAAIDPIFVLSDSARKTQMGLISDFNKKWGKRAQETNYNLSEEDRQNMITDKNYITSVAQDQLATMDKYKQHRQLVEQHPDKFDAVEFAKATDNYMLTGHYDQTTPAWKPIDFGAYARDAAQKQEFVFDETKKDLGNGTWAIESYNMPDKTQGRFLVGLLGRNPQADADFFARWNKADKEKWFKLADENKDNSLSTEEEKNAIALWASEEFKDVRMSKQSAAKGTSGTGKAKTDSNFASIDLGMGTPIKYKPSERQTYRNYKTFHSVPEWPTMNISTPKNINVYKPNGTVVKAGDKPLSLQLYGYDEDTDQFTFIAKSNYSGGGTTGSGDDIAISRKDLPAEFGEFEILVNGKRMKVRDLKAGGTTGTTPSNVIDVSSIFGGKQDSTKPVR